MDASVAFWNKITSTLAIKPVANVKKSQRQATLLQFQKLGANVSLASVRETLSLAFDEAAEVQSERMAGDDLDLVGDERDSRLELAAFDNRLAKRDVGFTETYEPDKTVSDGLTWSDEASTLAKALAADMRLDKQRRPELSTRPFLLAYFNTLRLVDVNITRVDRGMRDLINLKSLSLSSNQISVLSVPCLPPNLEVLNMYDCGLQTIKTTFRDRHRQTQHVTLPSLLHFGAGCNGLDENGLMSIAKAFPSLTSLDMCNNGLSQTKQVLDLINESLPGVQSLVLVGNSMTMELGYRSRTITTLSNVTRLDDQEHDEDDARAAKEMVNTLGLNGDRDTTSGAGGAGGAGGAKEGEKTESGAVEGEEGGMMHVFANAYEPGTVAMRVRVGQLSRLPGPVVEVVPPSEESVAAAEEKGEEPPPPKYIVEHAAVQEGTTDTEQMMNDAETIDLRYFIRLVPPGSMGISQTTNAKIWKYPSIAFNEDITLSVPLTSDLAFDTKFIGMKYEIYSSMPGVKKEEPAVEEEKEGKGGEEKEEKAEKEEKEEVVVQELTEEEQAAKDAADEAARVEAAKPPPRVEVLVATGVMDIGPCLDCMTDAQCSIKKSTIDLEPPNPLMKDPLALTQVMKSIEERKGTTAAQEGDQEQDPSETGVLKMPSLVCSVDLNPQTAPEPMESEEGGSKPGTGKPGSKKGKKKK